MRLGIIGGGRAAWAFGNGWSGARRPLAGVALRPGSRSDLPERLRASRRSLEELAATADLLLIAVPDPALAETAERLATAAPAAARMFHPSGAITSAVFGGRPGAFSLHPLRSLPPVGASVDLEGTLFVFEGRDDARPVAAEITATLGGTLGEIASEAKVLYHAAAVLASNDVAALLEVARGLMRGCGLDEGRLRAALAALARSAIENWEHSTARFTGPVARGDAATIERHLAALASVDPERAELYRRLALEIANAIAREAPDAPEVSRIIELLRTWTVP